MRLARLIGDFVSAAKRITNLKGTDKPVPPRIRIFNRRPPSLSDCWVRYLLNDAQALPWTAGLARSDVLYSHSVGLRLAYAGGRDAPRSQ